MIEEDTTVRVRLCVRIGEMELSISQAVPGVIFRQHPVASLEARIQQMLIQMIPSTVSAFDARAKLLAQQKPL